MKTEKGFRFLLTGSLLLVLMLSGCPMPETGTITGMTGEYQEETDARAAFMTGKVIQVASGGNASFILQSNGTLWACGEGGQLGAGDYLDRMSYVQVLSNVKYVAAGYLHTMAIKNDGTLWATGYNYYGQLGTGNNNDQDIFIRVTGISNVTAVACGYYHTLALRSDGYLYATGQNDQYQLGIGNSTDQNSFTRAKDWDGNYIRGVKAMAAGDWHSMALKTDGTLWVTGTNTDGQLGVPEESNPVFYCVPGIENIKAVACGNRHSLILKTDGTMWATGFNNNGELGLNDTNQRSSFTQVPGMTAVSKIACGSNHSLAITADGNLYTTGSNSYGQLGSHYIYDHDDTFLFINSDFTAIAGGSNHTLAIRGNGIVWVTGSNLYGQQGLGLPTGLLTLNADFSAKVALRAYSNNRYVCADLDIWPDGPLYSNKSAIGLWETFLMIDKEEQGTGKVAFRSYATSGNSHRFVTATNNGTSRAKADSPYIGGAELFGLVKVTNIPNRNIVYAFKCINNKYLHYNTFIGSQSSLGSSVYFYIVNAW